MAKKSRDPTDKQVGARVRMRRLTVGMSQQKLAGGLGIAFQQVQKYEKGTNRIGAGRLQKIAQILDVPIGFFFQDRPAPGAKQAHPSDVSDFLATAQGLALVKAFMSIRDERLRRCIVVLVEVTARGDKRSKPAQA
ncbi:MAG TPA: helix-turn-helix transcriptional regulator [Bradyrhizobium sp.]|nr:helix-turn-helix transcriptional regulator [Bradyrhizobium sp.]